jgi:glycosyltransferase involved in cell wall biosynthesis
MGTIVNLYWKLEDPANGISQVLSKFGGCSGIANQREIHFKNVSKENIYIIHGCYSWPMVSYFLTLVLSGSRFYWCPHGSLQKNTLKNGYVKKCLFHLFISSFLYFFSQGVIYVSAQERLRSPRIFWGKSVVITNGLETISDQSVLAEVTRPREFAYVGRLDPFHKGLDRLAEWGAPLGAALNVFGPLNDTIQSQFPSLNFRGPIYGDDKIRLLMDVRALVMLSRYEGLPVVAIEALRSGTPLILTDECNMSDVINKYKCGFIVNSQKELLSACSYLSSLSDEAFSEYSRNALNAFYQCYTVEKMIDGYRGLQ